MASTRSRKRKRAVELSPIAGWEGDTTTAGLQHTSTSDASNGRIPLTKPRTRASEARGTQKAPDAHGVLPINTTPARNGSAIEPLQANEDADRAIPANCCSHCLTRGGNAAYECFTDEGKEVCTRCIRDKKKCRIPTNDELAAISARCLRCIQRGFKTCDGGDPCDTCKKNKTSHLCWKQPVKKPKSDQQPSKSNRTRQSTSVAPTRSSRPRSAKLAHHNGTREDEQHPAACKPTSYLPNSIGIPIPQQRQSTGINKTRTPKHLLVAKERLTGKPNWASDSNDGLPAPVTSNDHLHGDCIGLVATSNSDDIAVTEEAEAQDIVRTSSPELKVRSKRSRTRVSYVEQFQIDISDNDGELQEYIHDNEDDDTDAYDAPTSDEESEAEIDPVSSDNEALVPGDDEENKSMSPGELLAINDDEPEVKSCKPNKTSVLARAGKGIDLSLPPLSSIEQCMSDMTAKAVQLGLRDSLSRMKGQPIRIATMCSGTESPLLALDEISKALTEKGHPAIPFQQEFSAEIEVFKQAFIERNFHPKILFRDVRDFICEPATTATTAYGVEVEIPAGIDILVAGFVCKDLSRMNTKGKTLKDGGESGDTWLAVYTYAKRFRPSIVLLENVKSEKATWEDVVSRWDKINYEAAWVFCDTKNYYLPQTRERMYMVAIERIHFGKGVDRAVTRWTETMQSLERQCSSPYEAFLPESLKDSTGYTTLKSEPDWALCKLRNDHIRSEKRLGILSPISRRNDNGTIMPPDFADRKFYNSQSSRVHDAIDIAHLQGAQKGFDSMYKMALWDVSQNVDRFKAELGIAPCLTPGGQDFASNRQHTLNGSQLLLLQGMPLARLLVANETQKDLQNLAGNAMSTTVIGASLISALICGSRAFRLQPSIIRNETPTEEVSTEQHIVVQVESMSRTLLKPIIYKALDLNRLKQEAQLTARLCSCEGRLTSRAIIQICSACGHSACASCAGNPKHVYQHTVPNSQRKQNLIDFASQWRSRLPGRLQLDLLPAIHRITSNAQAPGPLLSSYLGLLPEAQNTSQCFCIGDFTRQEQSWKVAYISPHATLELKLGEDIEWLLFLKCPPSLPGDSALRGILKSPIAHGAVRTSLLDAEWTVRLHSLEKVQLQVRGSSERVSSWRNRLGLQDYKEETVPMYLRFHSNRQDLAAVTCDYEHLPHCGTASSSLYKRLTGDEPMFLFLDPDPIGSPDHDSFVFSRDHTKKHFGESRISLVHLAPTWRPWHVEHDSSYTLDATIPDVWVPANLKLKSACATSEVKFFDEQRPSKNGIPQCSQALKVLDILVHCQISVQTFSDYSWALERPRLLPSCSSWQPVEPSSTETCSCAPRYPDLIWNVNGKGVATAHEDRQATAVFERAIKHRPEVFLLESSSEEVGTRIQVALDIMSLVHRACGRLLSPEATVFAAWRLITDHVDLPSRPFAKLRMQSNARDLDKPVATAPAYLRGAQLQSLSWMVDQERGKKITVAETEEAIHSGLGWRVEAQAETVRFIRGGVLADQPSFGKTVATIGLIQSEFDMHTPEALLQNNQSLTTELPGLIDSIATLVVCPPHISRQWQSELEKFLLVEQLKQYNVLIIEDYAQLRNLTIEDFSASRVVIVSWTLFTEEEYVSELANVVALPEPAMTSRRGFDSWMKRAAEDMPRQLSIRQVHGYQEFERRTMELLEERLQHPEFTATLPLKIQHGSSYRSFSAMQSAGHASKYPKGKGKALASQKARTKTRSHLVPLLHLFQFNRIVVDEYHYLNDIKRIESNLIATAVKHISAHKRWVLSGTPALANFSDVSQIASFLGVRLGRHFLGDGVVTTSAEKLASVDQTDVESFLSQTEVMSRQWHETRHQRAQQFLDKFARQNEAELQHIPCVETLVPVGLEAAHHAVYLELSQHLISQRMQIKKFNKRSSSDRTNRLHESLQNCASAEEALLKSALLFETENGESGLDLLISKRSEQLRDTEAELAELMGHFESLMVKERKRQRETKSKSNAEPGIADLYDHFKRDIARYNWLGDEEASVDIRKLLVKAEKAPTSIFPELKKASGEQRVRLIKQLLSQLREISLEFAHRIRSKRFIQSIRDYLQHRKSSQENPYKCSSLNCSGTTDAGDLKLVPHCGHTACSDCLASRANDESCVHSGCTAQVVDGNLIRMADLGSSEGHNIGHSFGKKLAAIVQLVKKMPNSEQGIVFAPNEEIISIIEGVLRHHKVSYHSPSRSKRSVSAKIMEDFKTNKDPKTRRKLLILKLGSESAAGVNLVNANHILFVSPLLTKTQYDYDSAMAQAVARSRRYGQEKTVHVYHAVAQRTIDVNILEHQHKRSDAMTTWKSTSQLPETCSTKKERTKFVRNNKGEVMLVPRTWLVDDTKRKVLGLGKKVDDLTSLINLPEIFEYEDDDEEDI